MIHAPLWSTTDDSFWLDPRPSATLRCDAVRDKNQRLVDLSVQWVSAQAQAVLPINSERLRPATLVSSWFDDGRAPFADLIARLDQHGSTAAELPAGDAHVRLRLTALDQGYVIVAERTDEPSQPVTPTPAPSPISDSLWPIVDNLPGAVALWDPIRDTNGTIVDFKPVLINAVMGGVTNSDREPMQPQSLLTGFPNLKDEGFFDQIVAVAEDGQPQTYTHSYQSNGETHWLNASLTRVGSRVLIYSQDITDRKRIEADLVRRLELESIISSISGRLINTDSSALNQCILDALAQMGHYKQADRVSIFLCSPDRQFIDCQYEWCASGIASLQHLQRNLPLVQFDWLNRMIEKQEVIILRSANELSAEAIEEKQAMQSQGIRSLLSLPLVSDGESRGMICFCTIGKERDWDATDTVLLQTFSGMLVNALLRRQHEDAVRRAYQRLQGLHRIDKALVESSLTNERPVIVAMRHLNDVISCERVLVFRFDPVTGLAHAEGRLRDGQVDVQPDVAVPAHFFKRSARLLAGETVTISDLQPNHPTVPPGLGLYERGFRSLVLIPLFSQEQYIGAFILLATTPNFFTDEHLQVAGEVARQLAIALYQQHLRDQVRQHTELLELRVAQRTAEIRQLSTLQNAILEHAGLAILSTDKDGLIQTMNPAAERLLGYRAAELIGRASPTLLNADPAVVAILPRLDDPAVPAQTTPLPGYQQLAGVLLDKAGRSIPVLLTTSALQDETGAISGYVGMAADITDLKNVEAELQRKNQELETFFEGSIDLHAIAQADATLLKINRSWERMLGYTTAEILASDVMTLIHPDDQAETVARVEGILRGLPLERMVNRLRKKDGTYCTIEWNAIAHDNLIYASARDITEQRAAEEQVRDVNRRLQLATRAARQGIWELNLADNTLFWDERLHELHGTSPATFGCHIRDFLAIVHPDDREYMQNLGSLIGEQNEPVVAEKRIILPDGSIRHLETHCQWALGPDGVPEKMVGVSWNITQRKQTELALRQSEARYRSLVNNLKEIVFQTDLSGRWTYLNPAWETITGYSVAESLGQVFNHLVDVDTHSLTWQLFQSLVNERKTAFQYTIQFRHRSGAYRWVDILAHVMLNNEGQPVGATGTITEITERKQALDALRDSEQRFREFATNVDEVFWIHAADPFRLLYVNPAYERLWGQSCASLHEDLSSFLNPILDEDKPAVVRAFADYREGREGMLEYRIRQADGSLKWISARNFVAKGADGNPVRHVGIANDITAQKEKELVLQQSLQREQELNKLKSQFISTVSHEFRTPLSTILSSVDLIRLYLNRPDASAKASVDRHLNVVGNEITNLNELLSDILTISRIDAGKVPFATRPADVLALASDVIDTHFAERSDGRAVRLRVDGAPRPISVDPKLITHVLVNLLSNAFKFSRQDPDLQITFGEDQVSLIVSDAGIGIPAADVPHLFETFFRARNALNVPGSGLGLMIARQFTEMHGGTLRIQSEENRGTTVTVTLPVRG